MKKIIFVLLSISLSSRAWASASVCLTLSDLFISQTATDEDEEERQSDEGGSDINQGSATKTQGTEKSAVPPNAASVKESPSTERQKLVSGAPLLNPNVAVHIVQKKETADVRKSEVVLYPAVAQVNGKFTQHFGTALTSLYHLNENFAFQLSGQYNWISEEAALNEELVDKAKQQAQTATSLLMVWGAQAGVEVTPIYGKFAWYENSLFNFQFVINSGAGIAATRHQLKPATESSAASYGDTGMKFLGSLGAGVRVQFKERFALRLEARNLVYTARADSVNGCDATDLTALKSAVTNSRPLSSAPVSRTCRVDTFDGTDSQTGRKNSENISLATDLVTNPSSDVLNNVGLYAGFAFLF